MKKRNDEFIRGLPTVEKMVVQKSIPLFTLWRSELSLAEFKILDTYLSRINSHDPVHRTVIFTKGELESLLQVGKINKSALKERLKHLMGSVVELPDFENENGFRLVTLFDEALSVQDPDSGAWEIRLKCTEGAMKYFFNIENLGYLRYKLRCITSITSRYTYIMFIYLESNRFRKEWEVSLDTLKELLNCEEEPLYQQFKFFNQRILKRVQIELEEKTECRYRYEPIKRGRKIVGVRFVMEELPAEYLIEPHKFDVETEHIDTTYHALWENIFESPGGGYIFTPAQMEELRSIICVIPEHKLPVCEWPTDSIDFRRFHYLDQKYATLKRIEQEREIGNIYLYLLKMIKDDLNS